MHGSVRVCSVHFRNSTYVCTYSCVIHRSNNSVSCKLDEFVNTECVTLQSKFEMEKLPVLFYSYIRKIRISTKEFW